MTLRVLERPAPSPAQLARNVAGRQLEAGAVEVLGLHHGRVRHALHAWPRSRAGSAVSLLVDRLLVLVFAVPGFVMAETAGLFMLARFVSFAGPHPSGPVAAGLGVLLACATLAAFSALWVRPTQAARRVVVRRRLYRAMPDHTDSPAHAWAVAGTLASVPPPVFEITLAAVANIGIAAWAFHTGHAVHVAAAVNRFCLLAIGQAR